MPPRRAGGAEDPGGGQAADGPGDADVIMESITYAQLPEQIVVIRVKGRGNHVNSGALRDLFHQTSTPESCPAYVFDMRQCDSLDSTFMGIMATMAMRQQRVAHSRMTIANLSEHVRELLTMLGLKAILDMRQSGGVPETRGEDFADASTAPLGKLERLLMMIEAHQQLVDLDGGNEVKFHGVLQSLQDSLDRARKA